MSAATALLASFIPTLALAAEEGGANPIPSVNEGLMTAVAGVVIFLICAVVLGTKVWPTILGGLNARAKKISDEIEAAELARSQAKDALEQYQQSLAQARAEAQREIDKARSQAQTIAAELRTKADAELNQMREKAMRDIESAKRAAVAEVYGSATDLATTLAGKVLKRSINAADSQSLVEESIRELQAMTR